MSTRQQLQDLQRNFKPPDGLDRGRPREVRLTAGGRALVALSAVLFAGALAAGIGLEVKAGREREEQRLLAAQGAVAQGEVVRLWRARDDKRQPWIAYRFVVQGHAFEGRAKARLRVWSRLQPGSPLSVRYLPSAPTLHRAVGFEQRPLPAAVPYLAALALALGSGLALVPLHGQRGFLAEGRPARAVVTRHSKDQHGTVAHFEFATLGGTIAAGKLRPSRKPLAVGSTLCVLYDPENPRSNAAYPLALLRPARGPLTPRPR